MKGKSQVLSLETHYRVPSGDPEESTRRSFQSMMSILREI